MCNSLWNRALTTIMLGGHGGDIPVIENISSNLKAQFFRTSVLKRGIMNLVLSIWRFFLTILLLA